MEDITKAMLRYILSDGKHDPVCRLCWTDSEECSSLDRPLFIASEGYRGTVTIRNILLQLFQLQNYSDKRFPQNICDSCLETVLRIFQFRQLCRQTEKLMAAQLSWLSKRVTSLHLHVVKKKKSKYTDENSAVLFLNSKKVNYIDNSGENTCLKLRKIQENLNEKFASAEAIETNMKASKLLKNIQDKRLTSKTDLKSESKVDRTDIEFKCCLCKENFKRARDVSIHTWNVHNIQGDVKLQNKERARQKLNLERNKKNNQHTSNDTYLCDYCQKSFSRKSTLHHHIVTLHMHPSRFHCSACGKRFSTKTQLESHQIVHTRERNEQCHVCGKYFVTKYALTYHMRLHTGERPYKCDMCNEKFLSASRRMAHVRRKHRGRTETCSICTKSYYTGYGLKRHMRRHYDPKSTLFENNLLT